MGQRFKVEELLSLPEMEELRTFAREPGRTIDECHEWMQARGYTLSRDAVYNWKRKFDEEQMRDRMSRSGEFARAMKEALSGKSFDDVADAAVVGLTQIVFEDVTKMQAEGDVDPDRVASMSKSLKTLMGTKEQHTRMLKEKFEAAVFKLKSSKREITQADFDAVSAEVFG